MITITPQNLTTAPINWALLPKNLQSEKENLELYQEFYNDDTSIKQNVDKLIEVIKKTHQATGKKPAVKKAKGVKKLPAVKAPAKTKLPRKKKKTVKRAAAPKKKKPIKAKKAIKRKATPKPKQEKAPVTVKKLSAELNLIRTFAGWNGKPRKITAVKSYLKRLETVKKGTNVPSHKAILNQIASKIKLGLANIEEGVEQIGKVNITADLLTKCKAAVKNAKPRLQVQYLSGLKGKK